MRGDDPATNVRRLRSSLLLWLAAGLEGVRRTLD
jgi:hypothetical protein